LETEVRFALLKATNAIPLSAGLLWELVPQQFQCKADLGLTEFIGIPCLFFNQFQEFVIEEVEGKVYDKTFYLIRISFTTKVPEVEAEMKASAAKTETEGETETEIKAEAETEVDTETGMEKQSM
jgi:hypothetical protein